jgi:cyclohexa-1,5-dienecarbonyl-CoA hydratase
MPQNKVPKGGQQPGNGAAEQKSEPVGVEDQSDLIAGVPRVLEPEDFRFIRYCLEGNVAHLTLNRPEHNLLHEPMLRELATAIAQAGDASEIKLILLDAAGKVFSGGIDLGEYTQQRVFQVLDAFESAFLAMLETGKPVLVVVNGPAVGGGSELAAMGDVVVATPAARFAQPEVTIGVFPPLGATVLPHLIGPKQALELVLTGATITAERALELGLVNRVVPETELAQTVQSLVEQITAQSGPVLAMAKRAVLSGMGRSLRDAIHHSIHIFLYELYGLEDSQEGLRAVVERRKPNWKNR